MRVRTKALWLGTFGWIAGLAAQEYVGSQACSTCHKAIYEHWTRSAMGRSMSPAGNHANKAAKEVTVRSEKLRRDFAVLADGGTLKQRESGDGFRNEHALSWAIGSGVNGLSFVVQRGDHLFQAPLSYYSRIGKWDLSPGYEFADYGFNRTIPSACISCHSGRPQPVAGANGQYANPPFGELAIGCENCHGPGQKHIVQKGARAAIVNPARLPAERADEICMNCHQGGDTRILQPGKTEQDFRPGMRLNDIVAIFRLPRSRDNVQDSDLLEHHESMRLSQCFTKSGTMSCRTCHNPHASQIDYRAKCLNCHVNKVGSATHPGRSSDCIGCHMPKRNVEVIAHSALTNHRISRQPGQPLPDSAFSGPDLVHSNRIEGQPLALLTELQAYGQMADRQPAYLERFNRLLDQAAKTAPGHPLVLATLGRRALRANQLPEAVTHLQAALEAGSKSFTTFEDLGDALGRSGRLEESAAVLQQGIQAAPFTAVLYKALALRFIQLKRYEQAKAALEQYVERFPEDDFVRKLLQQVSGPR